MTFDARTQNALERARQQVFQAHYRDSNFTGCGIGFRRRGGIVTDEPAVVAMVINKRPASIVSRGRLLPQAVTIDGQPYRVDVVKAGPLSFSALTSARAQAAPDGSGPPVTGIMRPPLQGCSISNFNNGATGTFGCLVTDNSDGTWCVLSSQHVMARDGQAVSGELIIQPAAQDGGIEALGIALLKRWIAIGQGTNDVDAAIAQLIDQDNISQAVADSLMGPISPSHPVVGMLVADDSQTCGRNCFLSRIDTTIDLLNVTMAAATASSPAVIAPSVGMNIEKVGRTTGYTSSTVDAIGVQAKVNYGSISYTLSDLIWTQAFSLQGDSGAVACQGGNGTTYAPLNPACEGGGSGGGCALLDAISTYYDIPLNTSANNTLADNFRDNFLAQSNTGQLLIGTTYLNTQAVINRLNSATGAAYNQSQAQAEAQALYSEYHALESVLAGSAGSTAVVTSEQVNAVAQILSGLTRPADSGGTGMLNAAESRAGWVLFSDILVNVIGMNRQQVIDYMNMSSVFQRVRSGLASVPTIGSISP
jgi:hypothetical protein